MHILANQMSYQTSRVGDRRNSKGQKVKQRKARVTVYDILITTITRHEILNELFSTHFGRRVSSVDGELSTVVSELL